MKKGILFILLLTVVNAGYADLTTMQMSNYLKSSDSFGISLDYVAPNYVLNEPNIYQGIGFDFRSRLDGWGYTYGVGISIPATLVLWAFRIPFVCPWFYGGLMNNIATIPLKNNLFVNFYTIAKLKGLYPGLFCLDVGIGMNYIASGLEFFIETGSSLEIIPITYYGPTRDFFANLGVSFDFFSTNRITEYMKHPTPQVVYPSFELGFALSTLNPKYELQFRQRFGTLGYRISLGLDPSALGFDLGLMTTIAHFGSPHFLYNHTYTFFQLGYKASDSLTNSFYDELGFGTEFFVLDTVSFFGELGLQRPLFTPIPATTNLNLLLKIGMGICLDTYPKASISTNKVVQEIFIPPMNAIGVQLGGFGSTGLAYRIWFDKLGLKINGFYTPQGMEFSTVTGLEYSGDMLSMDYGLGIGVMYSFLQSGDSTLFFQMYAAGYAGLASVREYTTNKFFPARPEYIYGIGIGMELLLISHISIYLEGYIAQDTIFKGNLFVDPQVGLQWRF